MRTPACRPPRGGPAGGFGRFGNFQQQTFEPDFYFYDLNSKLTFLPTSSDVLTLSVYGGEDRLDKSTPGQEIATPAGDTRLTPDRADLSNWGNRGVSGRWARQWGSRLATDALFAYSQYFSEATLDVASSQFARGFDEDNRVKDLTARLDNTWRPFPSSEIGFGAQFTRSDVGYTLTRLRGDSAQTLHLDGESNLTAGYLQHSWTPSARAELTAGLRVTNYDGTGQTYWEPRASARYSLTDRLSLTGAWGRYNQFVKRVENEDILEGSRDFWILAGDNIAPSSAEHWIAGIGYETDDYLFDVEAYVRDLGGVAQFSTRSRRAPGQQLAELFFEGTGTARGIELLAQKKRGALTGWIGYTFANVEHELAGFNDGFAFPASHDQRHEVKAVGSYQLGRWTLTGGWVYGSGKPYTVPEAQYPITLLDGRTLNYIHVGSKNGERLPAYHRLDLAASRRFEVREFFYEVNLSVFNVYGRNNVWYRQFDLTDLPMLVTDVDNAWIHAQHRRSRGLSVEENDREDMELLRSFIAALALGAAAACDDDLAFAPETPDTFVVQAFLFAGEPVTEVTVTGVLPIDADSTAVAAPIADARIEIFRDGRTVRPQPHSEGEPGRYHYLGDDLLDRSRRCLHPGGLSRRPHGDRGDGGAGPAAGVVAVGDRHGAPAVRRPGRRPPARIGRRAGGALGELGQRAPLPGGRQSRGGSGALCREPLRGRVRPALRPTPDGG